MTKEERLDKAVRAFLEVMGPMGSQALKPTKKRKG